MGLGLRPLFLTIAAHGPFPRRLAVLPALSPDARSCRFLDDEYAAVPFHPSAALADEVLMVLLRAEESEAVANRIVVDVVQAVLARAA
jgi:hypothetical protein